MKVLWKMAMGLLNWHLTTAIEFYETFNGFRVGQGMGTASLETKLIQQMK